uniref:Uncharacterized protein n=1 Tax=Aegilops tauschii subsp. strangulata TaxID=200361 RepID=A0A453EA75_AEGTS
MVLPTWHLRPDGAFRVVRGCVKVCLRRIRVIQSMLSLVNPLRSSLRSCVYGWSDGCYSSVLVMCHLSTITSRFSTTTKFVRLQSRRATRRRPSVHSRAYIHR